VVEGGALFIHDIDTGNERGLHVNDNRVVEGGTTLRTATSSGWAPPATPRW